MRTAEASARRIVDELKFVVGEPLSTYVSAVELKVSVVEGKACAFTLPPRWVTNGRSARTIHSRSAPRRTALRLTACRKLMFRPSPGSDGSCRVRGRARPCGR